MKTWKMAMSLQITTLICNFYCKNYFCKVTSGGCTIQNLKYPWTSIVKLLSEITDIPVSVRNWWCSFRVFECESRIYFFNYVTLTNNVVIVVIIFRFVFEKFWLFWFAFISICVFAVVKWDISENFVLRKLPV